MIQDNEFYLLNALDTALFTVKFKAQPEDTGEVAGSPLVAELCNRTYDALIAAERAKANFGNAQRLETARERSLDKPDTVLKAVMAHIRWHKEQWDQWGYTQKQEFVSILLAPYRLSSKDMKRLIEDADAQ